MTKSRQRVIGAIAEIRLLANFGMATGRLNLILMLCRRRIERSEMEKALTFLVIAFVIAFMKLIINSVVNAVLN